MSIVHTVDRIAHWLEQKVCEGWELKPAPTGADTVDYDYQLVKPCVWPLYDPIYANDHAPNVQTLAPSILVQIKDGSDAMYDGNRIYNIRLSFNVYDPGVHGEDWIYPYCDIETKEVRYRRGTHGSFEVQFDGWRDVWNLVDRTVRILENHESIDGLPIVKDQGVSFGPFTYADEIPDMYPLWMAWVEFQVQERTIRNTDYKQFL